MNGPYTLSNYEIDQRVTRTSPGAYLLGRTRESVKYVGRSDDDLNARLKHWVGRCSYFWFEYATSKQDAFDKECNHYHYYGGGQGKLDNDRHPQRPTGTNWKCPKCSIYG